MISCYSIFQLLPLHVVEAIIKYVLVTYHERYSSDKQAMFSLIHICHSWREVFKKLRCTNLVVEYKPTDPHFHNGSKGRFTLNIENWSDCLGYPAFSIYDLVKTVKFRFQYSQLLNEKSFLQCFLDSGYTGISLKSAKRLEIDFDCRGHILNDNCMCSSEQMDDFVQNIFGFLQHVKQIAPNIHEMSIKWETIYTKTANSPDDSTFVNLILKLADGIKDIQLYGFVSSASVSHDIPSVFTGLTNFFYVSKNCSLGVDIILLNSTTLQKLTVIDMADAHVERLFYNDMDEPIIYPCLTKFTLICNDFLFARPVRKQSCHFPRLESIKLDGSYPKLSSSFFNDNSTLKYLGLRIRHELMSRINKDRLFDSCNLRQLNHLYVDYSFTRSQLNSSYSRYINNSEAAEYLELLFKSTDCLRSLTLYFFRYEKKIIDVMAGTRAFANIQKLDFQMHNITFNDIVLVLGNVPRVCVFRCCPVKDQPSIDGDKDEILLQYIESRKYPLSKYLSRIYVHYGPALYVDSTCQALALLVAGCPRLSIVESSANYRPQFVAGFKKLTESQIYKPYHKRFETLFPKD